jgi:hypothetical protein
VVDKKGTVTRVIIGFSPETDAKLREAVRAANGVR